MQNFDDVFVYSLNKPLTNNRVVSDLRYHGSRYRDEITVTHWHNGQQFLIEYSVF